MDYVIIVAGGKGLRMGGEIPKQFLPVNGKPVLMTQALKRGDLIRIGGGTYRFVPFCDETFQWDEL